MGAVLSFGLRELETGTLGARELAHHVTSENLEPEISYDGHSFHHMP